MKKIIDNDEYETISYVTHDKEPCKVIISVRKDTNIDLESILNHHAKTRRKSGD